MSIRSSFAILVLFPFLACSSGSEADEAARPNILLVVADDMGWSDVGTLGGEIDTPFIDELSRNGMLFTNFHVAGSGAPTRSMLLTGVDPHLTGLGAGVAHVAPNQEGQPGYEGYLNQNVVTVASLLRDGGYRTWISGKWGLGSEVDQGPEIRGFDRSFILVERAANHHVERGTGPDEPTVRYRENGAVVRLPPDFYSSDSYTDKVIEWMGNGRKGDGPFFACLTLTAPHWPLQAHKDLVKKYEGRYAIGWDAVRAGRFDRQRSKGLIGPTAKLPRRAQGVPAWSDLTPENKRIQARKMAIYAAMVERLDQNLGRLMTHLRETGEFDRTMILLVSDNGSEAWVPDQDPKMTRWIAETFNSDLENLGEPNSFVTYGPAWAQVSATPLRLHKGTTAEGGMRVPLVVHQPGLPSPGTRNLGFASAMDLAATILDLASVQHPGGQYKGRTVHPIQGRSLVPLISGDRTRLYDPEVPVGFELFGHEALVMGEFKLLKLRPPFGDDRYELYDLIEDPSESTDLGPTKPERLRRMIEKYGQYSRDVGVIPPPKDFDSGH